MLLELQLRVNDGSFLLAVMTSFLQEFDAQRAVLSEFIVSFLSPAFHLSHPQGIPEL